MFLISILLTVFIALLHVWFMVLEMFLWTKPLGLATFHMSPNQADATKILAQNQGLYNGFLAAGLVFSLLLGSPGHAVQVFFLVCVVIAGVFGGFTVSKRILLIQALPALIALFCIALAH